MGWRDISQPVKGGDLAAPQAGGAAKVFRRRFEILTEIARHHFHRRGQGNKGEGIGFNKDEAPPESFRDLDQSVNRDPPRARQDKAISNRDVRVAIHHPKIRNGLLLPRRIRNLAHHIS